MTKLTNSELESKIDGLLNRTHTALGKGNSVSWEVLVINNILRFHEEVEALIDKQVKEAIEKQRDEIRKQITKNMLTKQQVLEAIEEVKKYPGQYSTDYKNGRHNTLSQLRQEILKELGLDNKGDE